MGQLRPVAKFEDQDKMRKLAWPSHPPGKET
jgi:hypothetical protein